jgi:hypothetical protein
MKINRYWAKTKDKEFQTPRQLASFGGQSELEDQRGMSHNPKPRTKSHYQFHGWRQPSKRFFLKTEADSLLEDIGHKMMIQMKLRLKLTSSI